MSFLKWSDKLSAGVQFIDHEHHKLVDMVNDLHDGVMSGRSKEVVGKVLDELVDYTVTHFAHEEKYFGTKGYHEAAAHKHQHDELIRQVAEIQAQYKSGALGTLSMDLMKFLQKWLVVHIQGYDKRFGKHLSENGVR